MSMMEAVLPPGAVNGQAFWENIRDNIHPFVQVLCVNGYTFRAMDEKSRHFIAKQFMNHVQESVMFCRDGTGDDRYYLGAPRHFVAGCGMVLSTGGSDPIWIKRLESKPEIAAICAPPFPQKQVKIPRPPNAYILYRKERHSMVKRDNPGITNNEISQILGRSWNLESREVRQKYKAMSESIKESLLERHPDYQYKPRKPSEKKRRCRRTQARPAQSTTEENGVSSPESLSIGETSPTCSVTMA